MRLNDKLLGKPNQLIMDGGQDFINSTGLDFIVHQIQNKTPMGFYSLYAWGKLRTHVIELDNGECQLCKYRGILTVCRPARWVQKHKMQPDQFKTPHVHHLCEWLDYPQLAMNTANLVTLCESCHTETHFVIPEFNNDFENFNAEECFD